MGLYSVVSYATLFLRLLTEAVEKVGSSTFQVESAMDEQRQRSDRLCNGGILRLSNIGGDHKTCPKKLSISKKPILRHHSHGGARAHDQTHVKTEAAAGGGRKASLYMGLIMRTESPTRLGASGSPAALAHHGGRNLVRNPFETSKNHLFS